MSDLTERQSQIAQELLDIDGERPVVEPHAGTELKRRAITELQRLADELHPGAKAFISKSKLDDIHACDELYRLRSEPGSFTTNRGVVVGALTHRVLELVVVDQSRHPLLELTHAALVEACEKGDDNADFLNGLTLPERLDIVRDVNDATTKFRADWPPILAKWSPRVESPITVRVGRISLSAKPDLMLGIPRGDRARVFLADLKRGHMYPNHRAHTHFYALAETLRTRIPPYRVATYYVDAGEAISDDVTVDLLEAALRRTLDGAERMVAIENGERPQRRAGRMCRFCPARDDCDTYTDHRARERELAADDLAFDDDFAFEPDD